MTTQTDTTTKIEERHSGNGRPSPERREKSYTIYKANSRGSGGAMSFALNRDKQAVFIEAANQIGERKFDWEKKIIMKWGLADLGSILAAFQDREPETKLFHQTDRASSACYLKYRTDAKPGQSPFCLTLSRQNSETKEVAKVSVTISRSEAAILETLLKAAVTRIAGW